MKQKRYDSLLDEIAKTLKIKDRIILEQHEEITRLKKKLREIEAGKYPVDIERR